MIYLFYGTLISVDLAHCKFFRAKVAVFGKSGIRDGLTAFQDLCSDVFTTSRNQ